MTVGSEEQGAVYLAAPLTAPGEDDGEANGLIQMGYEEIYHIFCKQYVFALCLHCSQDFIGTTGTPGFINVFD